jgi:hypothetical protein
MESEAAEKEVVRLSYSNLEVKKRWSLASSLANIPFPSPIKKLKRERTVRFQTDEFDGQNEKKAPYKFEPDFSNYILPPPVVQTPPLQERGFVAWYRRVRRGLPMPIIVAIIVGTILLLTLIATLAGIYGSAAAHKKSGINTSNNTPPGNSNPNNTGTTTNPTPAGSLTISRPGLTSVNFTDSTGAMNHRVYWRDPTSGLLTGRDWNATSKVWGPGAAGSPGSKSILQPKLNTAIAAAASSDPFVSTSQKVL